MLEQVALALALVVCVWLVYRRLAPARRTGGCHQGECGCEQSPGVPQLAQISPRSRKRR
jgi:hypothetical protein